MRSLIGAAFQEPYILPDDVRLLSNLMIRVKNYSVASIYLRHQFDLNTSGKIESLQSMAYRGHLGDEEGCTIKNKRNIISIEFH